MRSRNFICVSLLVWSASSWAFDPLSVTAVIGAVSSVIDSGSEVSGAVSAFEELYSEVSPDSQISEEGAKLVSDIQELEALAREIGYTSEEISALGYSTSDDGKTLSSVFRKMTAAIRAGKRVSKLFMKLDSRAKAAQIETSETEKQQLAALYKLIRLQQKNNLMEAKKDLLELKEKKDQIKEMRSELSEQGAKVYGKLRILSFPKQTEIVETSLSIAMRMRPYLYSLILLVILMKATGYQFMFQINSNYEELLKNSVLCFLLLAVYPEIVRGTLELSHGLAKVFGNSDLQSIRPDQPNFTKVDGWSLNFKIWLLHKIEWLKYGVWFIADFISSFGLSMAILVIPIMIFVNLMVYSSTGFQGWYGLILALSLWPTFWNLLGMVGVLVWKNHDESVKSMILGGLFSMMQIISPLIAIKLLGGHGVSGSITRMIQKSKNSAQSLTQSIGRQMAGTWNGTQGVPGGGGGGRAIGWLGNQIASRTKNAVLSAQSDSSSIGMRYPEPQRISSKDRAKEGIRGFMLNKNTHSPSSGKTGRPGFTRGFVNSLKSQPISGREVSKS